MRGNGALRIECGHVGEIAGIHTRDDCMEQHVCKQEGAADGQAAAPAVNRRSAR